MNKEKNKRKTRRDLLLLAAVLLAITVAAVAVTPLVMSARYLAQYKAFEEDMIRRTLEAKRSGDFDATLDGEAVSVSMEQIEAMQALLVKKGPGIRDRKRPEEEGLRIRLGEAQMILAPMKLRGSGLKRETGVQIRYVYANGKEFAYDTDEFSFDQILRMFGD